MSSMLSAKDIQDEFNVSRATAYRLIKSMNAVRIGRCVRVSRIDLIKRIKENGGVLPTDQRGAVQ